jgi:ribosome modulation factor
MTTRKQSPEWRTHYAAGLAHPENVALLTRSPNKQPLRGCWARGYADGHTGGRIDECPYTHRSGHGGTWGYQAERAWRVGYAVGLREAER